MSDVEDVYDHLWPKKHTEHPGWGGGGVLPYMSYIGICEGYGFQRVYSRIGYRNQ